MISGWNIHSGACLSTGSSGESLRIKYNCTIYSSEVSFLRSKVHLWERSEVEKVYLSHSVQLHTIGKDWAGSGGSGLEVDAQVHAQVKSFPWVLFFSVPFPFCLEKLPMKSDNKIKAYLCIMKSAFFSEDNWGQTDKVQNYISSAAKASESPLVLIRKKHGVKLNHSQ